MKTALYSGTFDPFTLGHADILTRSLSLFDEVTLVVAIHPTKKTFFSVNERVAMLKELFKNDGRIKVDSYEGLIVDYAKKNKINTIVRGLRSVSDFESENQMASMNNKLYPKVETVFLMTRGDLNFISSSLLKEIFGHGGNIAPFVPKTILNKMKKLKK